MYGTAVMDTGGNQPSYCIITADIPVSAEKEDGSNGRQNCTLPKYIRNIR